MKAKKEINNKPKESNSFWTLIVAIIFGMFSGVTGDIIFNYYFDNDWQSSWVNQEWNLLDDDFDASKIIIRDAKKVVVSQDDKALEVANSIRPSIFSIFEEIDGASASTTPYNLSSPLLRAFAVSSDGWLLAAWPESLSRATSSLEKLVVLDNQRKQHTIDRLMAGIPDYPNLVFVHLQGAANLEAKRFASADEFFAVRSALATDGGDSLLSGYLYLADLPEGELSSDELVRSVVFSSDVDGGELVFGLGGEFLGLLKEDSSVYPAFAIKRYWESGVASGRLSPVSLGLSYYDLSYQYLPGIGRDKGALVTSVVMGGAAEKAGLRAGDIITHLDNLELSSSRNLSDLVSGYKAGDSLSLIYRRQEVESQAKATLQ